LVFNIIPKIFHSNSKNIARVSNKHIYEGKTTSIIPIPIYSDTIYEITLIPSTKTYIS